MQVAVVRGVMASITQPTTTILTMIVQEQNAGQVASVTELALTEHFPKQLGETARALARFRRRCTV